MLLLQYIYSHQPKSVIYHLDLNSVQLTLDDIELPPQVKMTKDDIPFASLSDLRTWLAFRGDSLKNTSITTECKVKYV